MAVWSRALSAGEVSDLFQVNGVVKEGESLAGEVVEGVAVPLVLGVGDEGQAEESALAHDHPAAIHLDALVHDPVLVVLVAAQRLPVRLFVHMRIPLFGEDYLLTHLDTRLACYAGQFFCPFFWIGLKIFAAPPAVLGNWPETWDDPPMSKVQKSLSLALLALLFPACDGDPCRTADDCTNLGKCTQQNSTCVVGWGLPPKKCISEEVSRKRPGV